MKKIYAIIIALFFIINISYAQEKENISQNTALILIDIQDFYFPGGLLPLDQPKKAALNAQKILHKFRSNNMLIIHIKHIASSGSDIHDLVKPIDEEIVITKNKANSFVNTELQNILHNNNITNIVLCGMQTHMCLEAATRAASDLGYNCTVISDACTTRDLKFNDNIVLAKDVHYSTLSTLNKTYATILTTEEYLNLKK